MRISVPHLPHALVGRAPVPPVPRELAIDRIATFLKPGNVAVLTGAGVSVDSGVKAYRGKDGRYMNPDYRPIFYQQLVEDSERGHSFRQRYWLRSYIGFPRVHLTQPNPTHYALAALQHASVITQLITQNVDGLHSRAISRVWDEAQIRQRLLELHGTIFKVQCMYGHVYDRGTFQTWFSEVNPHWHAYLDEVERVGEQPKTNPDGDVVLDASVSYADVVVPPCPGCIKEGRKTSIVKPDFVFFGESLRDEVKARSIRIVEEADRLFLLGTTLATYSAFRCVSQALVYQLRKPVLFLNVGPTRADDLPGVEKLEVPAGDVMRDVVRRVVGTRANYDPILREMLLSGVVKRPADSG
ncbi:DHS-like NAD/FAD-binding domain-containing protein [Vararia minispora EC-137]|uniref:DHS-like NAD/FAD-binding domain-containing protein n=1 Tax=Vararia minispora EC-137 TaxID=1314806 RepID=A0ACB8QQF6_9AGAM|nr:DHS-like NAD/FAD-binding domain-containing protein [Vararia minispora EC-137]